MEAGQIRFEAEQQQWEARQSRVAKKFGADFLKSMPYLKEKLAFLEGLEIRYGRGSNIDERLELAGYRQERREIEKMLYPSLLTRLAYKIMQAFIINRQQRVIQVTQQANLESVKSDLVAKGLGHAVKDFEEQARLGKQEFTIPVSYHVSEKESMSFKIDFQKDFNGDYRIKETTAVLKAEGQPKAGGTIKLEQKTGLELTADNAYRLLAGKSIKKDETWINLDFNDRDTMGNCVIRTFPKEFGYDLDLLLAEVTAKELERSADFQKVKSMLEDGHQVKLTRVGKSEEIIIEANPRQHSLSGEQQASQKSNTQQMPIATEKQQQQNRNKMKIG